MIRSLNMANLRGVELGSLDALAPLVALVGPNSSGKSTVLDALLIGAASKLPIGMKRAAQRRRATGPSKERKTAASEPDYRSLFFKTETFAEIVLRTDVATRRVVLRNSGEKTDIRGMTYATETQRWDTPAEEFFQRADPREAVDLIPDVRAVGIVDSRDLSSARSLEEAYTLTSQRGLRREVKAVMSELLPEVEDLEILAPNNIPTLHLNFEDHALPIGLAGDGVQLLLRHVMALASPPGTTLLLEEPETHMHPGAIRLLARAIHAAVARDVQVILTTHSLELIDALTLGVLDTQLARVAVYRLALERGTLESTRLDGPEAALARSSIEDDLR